MENLGKEINKSENVSKESIDASKEKENFLNQSILFENTKLYLNSVGNYYFNYLFSLLGYQYKGKVENLNVLHLCSEAWLLGALNELRKENNEKVAPSQKITYSQLLSQIKQIIVEENNFIDNINILIGIYGMRELANEDKNIFKMFLVNIQATKHQIFIEENEDLTKEKFEETIMRIFNVAFNYTLNEFDSEEKDKKSLDMYNTYLDMDIKEIPLSLENFIKSYNERKQIKSSLNDEDREKRLLISLEYFYNFLNTKFADLIEEIEFFNKNSSSVIFKLKTLFSYKNIQRMYSKYFDILTNSLEKGLRNLRLEGVLNFTRNIYAGVKPYGENSLAIAKKNYARVKDWIDSVADKSFVYYDKYSKDILQYSNRFYLATIKYSELPRRLVCERIYRPVRNLSVNLKENSVNLVVNTVEFGKNKTSQLRYFLEEKTKNIKDNVFGQEPLVKFESEAENNKYLNISIRKKLFIIDPTKAKELVSSIIDLVRSLSVKEITSSAYQYTKAKLDLTKNYVYNSYKKFLELANEEENEDEMVISKMTNENKIKKEKIQ